MTALILAFLHDEAGEDLIEYGLLASFVAVVAMATIIMDPIGLRTAIVMAFRKTMGALSLASQN